jgi:capsular exopolysaccharide synthesis family protein
MAGTTGQNGRRSASPESWTNAIQLTSILRARWPVVGITALFSVAAMLLVITMMRPYWRATASIVVNASGPQVLDDVRGVNDENLWDGGSYQRYFETQKSVLGSRRVAADALESLGLSEDETFLGVDRIESEEERAAKAAEVDPIERLREITRVREIRNSRVLVVDADYPQREVAEEIAEAVIQAYLADIADSRVDTGVQAKQNLEEERASALATLRDAETRLDAFKSEHQIMSISLEDRQNLITQNIITLSQKAKTAQASRIELEARHRQAERLHKAGDVEGALLLLEPAARELLDAMRTEQMEAERAFGAVKKRYGEKMVEYQEASNRLELANSRIEREGGQLLRSLGGELAAARDAEKSLSAALAKELERALELGRLEPEFRELEREVTTSADTYSVLSRRDAEIGITNRVERAPVEILDHATSSPDPVRPRKLLLLAASLLGGLTLGGLLALVIDLRDLRIRSASDLERALSGSGLVVLGQLPQLASNPKLGLGNVRAQRRNRDLYAHLHPKSLMAERCRAIRTTLTFSGPPTGPYVLLISSPGSGDGKSSTAMNLALSFCQAGKEVCLIDADMRRPRLHHVFPPAVGDEDEGLARVLQGEAEIMDVVRSDLVELPDHLSVLTCGAPPPNPAELLDSARFRHVLADLKREFDVIVIDSPPVLPVADPMIMAPEVDGIVLVTRCQSTTRTELQEAVATLGQGDSNILGVVLNEVDPRAGGGRYSAGYYAYYTRETTAGEA